MGGGCELQMPTTVSAPEAPAQRRVSATLWTEALSHRKTLRDL